jgi:hypothetical protein
MGCSLWKSKIAIGHLPVIHGLSQLHTFVYRGFPWISHLAMFDDTGGYCFAYAYAATVGAYAAHTFEGPTPV